MTRLFKIDEKKILEIIGEYYGVRSMDVCICKDFRFVRKGDDKVREDYIYGIVQKDEENSEDEE